MTLFKDSSHEKRLFYQKEADEEKKQIKDVQVNLIEQNENNEFIITLNHNYKEYEKVFSYKVSAGEYTSDSFIGLLWEIFKHRCWHLWKHGKWID